MCALILRKSVPSRLYPSQKWCDYRMFLLASSRSSRFLSAAEISASSRYVSHLFSEKSVGHYPDRDEMVGELMKGQRNLSVSQPVYGT